MLVNTTQQLLDISDQILLECLYELKIYYTLPEVQNEEKFYFSCLLYCTM